MNIVLIHYPQALDVQVFGEVFDVVVQEWVHVFDQDLDWGLRNHLRVVALVHYVLQEQHE